MRNLLLLLISACLSPAAEVRHLAEEARRLPAEFAADALLRLASAGTESAEWRRAQIEDAFNLAGSASRRFKVTGRSASGEPRNLDAFAGELGLDTLSLQSRAARAMLSRDAGRARELFQQIVLPAPEETPCGSAPADLAPYYEAASQILSRGFTPEQRRRGEPFQLAMSLVRGVKTAEQLGPTARMIREAGLIGGESHAAIAAFAEALSQLRAADVTFSAAVWRDGLLDQVSALASTLESAGASVEPLAQGLRRFLVSHLTGARCASADESAALGVRDAFNRRYGSLTEPIAIEETRPAGAAQVAAQASEPGFREITNQLRRLRFTTRDNPEWKHMQRQAVEAIEAWAPQDSGGAEAFHRKAGLLQALLGLLPDEESRERVLHTYTAMVVGSPVRQSHPAGWFLHALALERRLRNSASPPPMLKDLEAAGEGLLAYYAALDHAAPKPRPACPGDGVCFDFSDPELLRAELVAFLLN